MTAPLPYVEKVVSFGPEQILQGILCVPRGERRPNSPCVLSWNTGIHHRVGPFRFYVELNRHLATVGFASLRFDVSGMGDSRARTQALDERSKSLLDIQDAMAFAQERLGNQTVALVGFCSSVDAAFHCAQNESRVGSMIWIEGYSYRTRGFARRGLRRYFNLHRWRRRIDALRTPSESVGEPVFVRDIPSPENLARALESFAQRGTPLMFAYAGGDTDFNSEKQFWEMLPGDLPALRRVAEVKYYEDADHIFQRPPDRQKLISDIADFLSASFPR